MYANEKFRINCKIKYFKICYFSYYFFCDNCSELNDCVPYQLLHISYHNNSKNYFYFLAIVYYKWTMEFYYKKII